MSTIPAITLWQPWASWIEMGLKTIETRLHTRFRCLVGKRIAIHAGMKIDLSAWTEARRWRASGLCVPCLPRGMVLCTALVDDFRLLDGVDSHDALIDCGGGITRYGLVLTDVQSLDPPIPATGHQGIWNWQEREDEA